ncbi:MAG: OmpA family protein [Bdellovibrionales bacterium]|nr:OmpA family protein [Bdellovibrionales bacterium]
MRHLSLIGSSIFPFLASCILVLSGCSSMGGGSGEGEGSLSENSLGSQLDSQREARFGEGDIPSAEGSGIFRDIQFDFDSYSVGDLARQNIEYNVEILKANPDVKVQLEGHCDERGTAEYNMALGSKRATSVFDILSSYGIPRSRLETISYGSEVPLDTSASETAWARNRRVHFSAFREIPEG